MLIGYISCIRALALVAQSVECLLQGTGGHGFSPWPQHTKVIKMLLAAPRLALRLMGWSTQCQDNVTGCGIMLSVWGMILQWDSTIKVSIELSVAIRHYHEVTEKWLKATLNMNKQSCRRAATNICVCINIKKFFTSLITMVITKKVTYLP